MNVINILYAIYTIHPIIMVVYQTYLICKKLFVLLIMIGTRAYALFKRLSLFLTYSQFKIKLLWLGQTS
ncbi:MAG TPA: hypothetical protein DC010_03810 [Psychrobacter sp.]|nr:hypothetical protein [Psychrobacter sp.]